MRIYRCIELIQTQPEKVYWHRQNQWARIYIFFIKNILQMEGNYLMMKEVVKEELKKVEG
mgnify:CR=1 FL=1